MSVARAIARKTVCDWRNARRILRRQSAFKLVFVLCFAVGCEAGLWWLFVSGFRFLDQFGGFGGMIMGRLISLFFLGLSLMLVVSGMVTSYATLFRSPETEFLLTQPLTVSQIVMYKFVEATALSSWAFFFVVIPFVGAYAWHQRLSLLFALWTVLFSIPFLALCSGVATLVVMAFARWFPAGRLRRACGVALAVAVAVGLWAVSRRAYASTDNIQFSLSRLVPGMMVASNVLVPSSWVAEGITSLANGRWGRGVMMWGVLASTALVLLVAVEGLGRRVFYECWQRVSAGSSNRRRAAVLFGRLDSWLRPLRGDLRAMILKDIRTFVRDASQWSQALVFFGLLLLYFVNLRSLRYQALGPHWVNMMVFLNVFSVSSVVCSLGARFVYPQLSLEGQQFWILGLSPTTMRRILLAKFGLASAGLLTVSVALVLLSSIRLGTAPAGRIVSAVLIAAVSLSVCGLSSGLGAVFLDLRQRNPAAIVSGAGGTLNLVLSLAYMLAAILPFGVVFHLAAIQVISPAQFGRGVACASVWLLVVTAVAVVVPLALGVRALRRRDF